MKLLLLLFALTSVSIAQVDSVFTKSDGVYSGKIVSGNSFAVFIETDQGQKLKLPLDTVKRIVPKNGEDVFGADIPKSSYLDYLYSLDSSSFRTDLAYFETPQVMPVFTAGADSLENQIDTQIVDPQSALSLEERSTVALETIAQLLTIQLAIGAASILITLIALS